MPRKTPSKTAKTTKPAAETPTKTPAADTATVAVRLLSVELTVSSKDRRHVWLAVSDDGQLFQLVKPLGARKVSPTDIRMIPAGDPINPAWSSINGSKPPFGKGKNPADTIREAIRTMEALGVTVPPDMRAKLAEAEQANGGKRAIKVFNPVVDAPAK